MASDQTLEVVRGTDAVQLQERLAGLVGKLCWQARLTYGDELSLHFGARLVYSSKRGTRGLAPSWQRATGGNRTELLHPATARGAARNVLRLSGGSAEQSRKAARGQTANGT